MKLAGFGGSLCYCQVIGKHSGISTCQTIKDILVKLGIKTLLGSNNFLREKLHESGDDDNFYFFIFISVNFFFCHLFAHERTTISQQY